MLSTIGIIIDVAIVLAVIISTIIGYRKGFLKSVLKEKESRTYLLLFIFFFRISIITVIFR